MKTAISIPDELFQDVERTAQQLGISRSELFARAARFYLDRHSPDEIRRSYDAGYRAVDSDEERRIRRAAARDLLSRVDW